VVNQYIDVIGTTGILVTIVKLIIIASVMPNSMSMHPVSKSNTVTMWWQEVIIGGLRQFMFKTNWRKWLRHNISPLMTLLVLLPMILVQ
jgi:hypothetical protein